MGDQVTILESNFDTLRFERAFIAKNPAAPDAASGVPRAIISGIECDIESKPTLIGDGLAYCAPVNDCPYWPIYTTIERDGVRQSFPNLTNHPAIVAAPQPTSILSSRPASPAQTSLSSVDCFIPGFLLHRPKAGQVSYSRPL